MSSPVLLLSAAWNLKKKENSQCDSACLELLMLTVHLYCCAVRPGDAQVPGGATQCWLGKLPAYFCIKDSEDRPVVNLSAFGSHVRRE